MEQQARLVPPAQLFSQVLPALRVQPVQRAAQWDPRAPQAQKDQKDQPAPTVLKEIPDQPDLKVIKV